MFASLFNVDPRWVAQAFLVLPLVLTGWIAVSDVKTRRIPNYLTLGGALAGLVFQALSYGWWGLQEGLLGLILGFGLLIIPYLLGGMGAGDVKALAALGAWLGPAKTFQLFLYMAIAGGVLALAVLAWRGFRGIQLRQLWTNAVNLILCRPHGLAGPDTSGPKGPGIPYGVALALGMLALFVVEK